MLRRHQGASLRISELDCQTATFTEDRFLPFFHVSLPCVIIALAAAGSHEHVTHKPTHLRVCQCRNHADTWTVLINALPPPRQQEATCIAGTCILCLRVLEAVAVLGRGSWALPLCLLPLTAVLRTDRVRGDAVPEFRLGTPCPDPGRSMPML